MVRFIVNGVDLTFWMYVKPDGSEAILYVKKTADTRDADSCEKYPVVGFGSDGTMWRYPGLPVGWGFRLTKDRKIKEIH